MLVALNQQQITTHLRLVQDLDLPHELFALIADRCRRSAYESAIRRALEPRPAATVVCHGPGALLWSMVAASSGATVVVCESGAYFAPLIRDVVADNGFSAQITVVQGGLQELPAAWQRGADLVVLDDIDSVLLGRGLLGQARFAREALLAPGGALIPASAELYCVPGSLLLGAQCGFDVQPMDRYRGVAPHEPVALVAEGFIQGAEPRRCASFTFEEGGEQLAQSLDFSFDVSLTLNGLAQWFVLHLDPETSWHNAPSADAPARKQGISFFSEPVEIPSRHTISLASSLRESTGLSFEVRTPTAQAMVPEAKTPERQIDAGFHSYGSLRPMLPPWHFPMLGDVGRNEAFVHAIERALMKRPDAAVLDIGAGSGLLAMGAARAGAGQVTACEMVPHIAELARQDISRNGVEEIVHIAGRASYDLRLGRDMPERASILVSETVDHGLLGEHFLVALAHAKEALLTADAQVIPAAATLYAVPIDLHTGYVSGFDLRAIDQLRLGHYCGMQLAETPHQPLAEAQAVYSFDFQQGDAQPAETRFEFPITRDGICNAVALYFDLKLDDDETISTAPGSGITAWDQGIIFFDQSIDLHQGDRLPLWCNHDLERVTLYPDPNFLGQIPHRVWPRRRSLWAMGLRAEAAQRQGSTVEIMSAMGAAAPGRLEGIWEALTSDDPELTWLRRDLLADLYAQLGYEL